MFAGMCTFSGLAFALTKGPRISSLLSVPPPQLLRRHLCLVHRFNANILRRVASTATANFAELCSKVFVVNAPSFAVKGWNLIK
eukprot:COSAG04_NODE_2352_length_4286_cov_6.280153_3_plen_84_part_00